jgi:hypothetical protein
LVVSAFVIAPAACGGSGPSDLFSGGAVDSGGQGDDAMAQVDSWKAAPDDAAAAADAATAMDTSTVPTPDAYSAPETSAVDAPGPTVTIPCGMAATCSVPAQFCCVSVGPQGSQTDTCVSGTNDCNGQMETPIECTSSAQCPGGQVCCGRVNNGVYGQVSCRMSCSAAGEYQFCDPAMPGDCPPTMACMPSTILDGFSRCL